ncbi:hypothetical protein [Pedobacter miscanthi]|uniref:Uncharacterized protein n=1 Tax=Pedobacter miscanthi TaxID=2259170 RepID=A0A366L558_9SPHI|nr:hypothetical protein [Pedobacter miscanthi]RBQ08956.1 hypothetical protein DRW42_07040 [Pedobacter miscanthi]
MEKKIISIADELRRSISMPSDGKPNNKSVNGNSVMPAGKQARDKKTIPTAGAILEAMSGFDCTGNTHMLHPRLDIRTVKLLNSFKLASGIDMNRFIAFSIHYLFQQHPELKTYIKQSLENFEL